MSDSARSTGARVKQCALGLGDSVKSATVGRGAKASAPSQSVPGLPKRKPQQGLIGTLRRAAMKLIFPFRQQLPENAVTADEAAKTFLGTMASTAARTSGLWRQQMENALADCLGADARRQFFDLYPVEDYYLTGVVALEAARIRQVYTPAESSKLLAAIGEQLDVAAGRNDRVMSDMLFDLIGRIEAESTSAQQKKPYDRVTKAILRHLNIHQNDATRDLMSDMAFRHALGEPLAVGIQDWWRAFQQRFVLHIPPEPEPEEAEESFAPAAALVEQPRRRRRPIRRAESLI